MAKTYKVFSYNVNSCEKDQIYRGTLKFVGDTWEIRKKNGELVVKSGNVILDGINSTEIYFMCSESFLTIWPAKSSVNLTLVGMRYANYAENYKYFVSSHIRELTRCGLGNTILFPQIGNKKDKYAVTLGNDEHGVFGWLSKSITGFGETELLRKAIHDNLVEVEVVDIDTRPLERGQENLKVKCVVRFK